MPDWAPKLQFKIGQPLTDALPVAPRKLTQLHPKHGVAKHAACVYATAAEGNEEPREIPQLVPHKQEGDAETQRASDTVEWGQRHKLGDTDRCE